MGKLIDLAGNKYENWTVIRRGENQGKHVCWYCKCDCQEPKFATIRGDSLKKGNVPYCECRTKHPKYRCTAENLIGNVYNRLTVLDITEDFTSSGNRLWKCQCSCENKTITYVTADNLRRGKVKSCGCLQKENTSLANSAKLEGQIFGHLKVIKRVGSNAQGQALWECECDCTGHTHIMTTTNKLTAGHTQSCGCVSSRGEELIGKILYQNNINYIKEKTFENCRFENGYPAYFDFYLPDYNTLIEYDGSQHFYYTGTGWNTEEQYNQTVVNDKYKNEWCKNNGVTLIRIPYTHYDLLDIKDLLPESSIFIV